MKKILFMSMIALNAQALNLPKAVKLPEAPSFTLPETKNDSVLGKLGAKGGDKLMKVDGKEIKSPAEFKNALAKPDIKAVTVKRGDRVIDLGQLPK
jgi:S1-C subfamily serine protease